MGVSKLSAQVFFKVNYSFNYTAIFIFIQADLPRTFRLLCNTFYSSDQSATLLNQTEEDKDNNK